MPRPSINIVWFKRDLRLRDHAPLCAAIDAEKPTILMFCLEPSLMKAPDADDRHWRFAWQAAQDLEEQLAAFGHKLLIYHQEMVDVLNTLKENFIIHTLFSHQETGHKLSFDRDKAVAQWCRQHQVEWQEYGQDGIIRGLRHRRRWAQQVENFLRSPLQHPNLNNLVTIQDTYLTVVRPLNNQLPNDHSRREAKDLRREDQPITPNYREQSEQITPMANDQMTNDPNLQPGGERNAWRYWRSFLAGRGENYGRFLSKPHLSRKSCSRLSPYLAWGNISVRELWQYCEKHKDHTPMGRALHNLQSRLWWRSHYLQKLESEWQMEFQPINRGFASLDRQYDEERFRAWAEGRSGYPMVDASMRCLIQTGWLNFRMRAMLATFATFTLWLPFAPVAKHLARQFLDYEPGIHYPQLQMQAGLTGYHTLRIYNPTVQAERHDPDGTFIHTWLPELRSVPAPQCHQPWRLTAMEQQLYGCDLGTDYPKPIVDFKTATATHRDKYWEVRMSEAVQSRLPAVWERHCLPESIKNYQNAESQRL